MRDAGMLRGLLLSSILVTAISFGPVSATADEVGLAVRLAKLERIVEGRGLVDLLQSVGELQREVQRLQGQIDEQSYTIEQLRKTQRDTYADIDQRLHGMEQRGGSDVGESNGVVTAPPLTTLTPQDTDTVAGTPAPQSSLQLEIRTNEAAVVASTGELPVAQPGSTRPAEIVSPPSIAPLGPTIDNQASEAAYKDAFSLLKAGQYDESIAAFSDFLQQHPNSQYADNAQYWLGETFYVRREFEPAVAEYQKLINLYPASKKRTHAMLKIGYSYHELGQIDKARAVLEDLRNRYAGSTAARLAEDRIQRMLAEASTQ